MSDLRLLLPNNHVLCLAGGLLAEPLTTRPLQCVPGFKPMIVGRCASASSPPSYRTPAYRLPLLGVMGVLHQSVVLPSCSPALTAALSPALSNNRCRTTLLQATHGHHLPGHSGPALPIRALIHTPLRPSLDGPLGTCNAHRALSLYTQAWTLKHKGRLYARCAAPTLVPQWQAQGWPGGAR